MDLNLTIMLTLVSFYVASLGIVSYKHQIKNEVNLDPAYRGFGTMALLGAIFFSFRWNSWTGLAALIAIIALGLVIMKAVLQGFKKD